MICVIQRAVSAAVTVNGETVGSCYSFSSAAGAKPRCLLVMAGIDSGDTEETMCKMAEKITALRIFEDGTGKMSLSVKDIGGSILSVPNFTLCASCRRGTRPDFTGAERPERAKVLYEGFVKALRAAEVPVGSGIFGEHMSIDCALDGPVTIVLDSEKNWSRM